MATYTLPFVRVNSPDRITCIPESRRLALRPFFVTYQPIPAWAFRQFAKDTGYITDAERNGEDWYMRHACVIACSEDQILSWPASCFSWNDAMAFARWAGARRPTDDEWLAASLIDNEPFRDAEMYHKGVFRSDTFPSVLYYAGTEWTVSEVDESTALTRNDPKTRIDPRRRSPRAIPCNKTQSNIFSVFRVIANDISELRSDLHPFVYATR